MSDEASDPRRIEYRITDDVFTPPDDHHVLDTNDQVYIGPYKPELERADGAGAIDILDYGEDNDCDAYHGPPELVADESGQLKIVGPEANGDGLAVESLGVWVCPQCDNRIDLSPISRRQAIQEPERCPACEWSNGFQFPTANFEAHHQDVAPLIESDPIFEPPGLPDESATMAEIWDGVYDHIHEHWDASGREWLYDGLTALAISTWFRPEFDFVPHLLIMGEHESGKTRLLNTLKQVSYRCVHTASASPSTVFRSIDSYNVTLYLSEYHDIDKDTQKTMDAVLKAGQKRGEIAMRAKEAVGGGYGVENFDPFTHVAISTQFEPRDDIQSRCFRIDARPATREVPRTLTDAAELRSQLLGARYRLLGSDEIAEARQRTREYMDENNLFARLGEKLWCLLTVADLAEADISEFVSEATKRARETKSESEEAMFLQAVIDEAFDSIGQSAVNDVDTDWSDLELKMTDICERFNRLTGREVRTQYMGTLRKRLGLDKQRKSGGTYIVGQDLQSELKELAAHHNLDWSASADLLEQTTRMQRQEMSQDELVSEIIGLVAEQGEMDRQQLVERISADESEVEHRIDELKKQGKLYSPEQGVIDNV